MTTLRTVLACMSAAALASSAGALAQVAPPPAANGTTITVSPPSVLRAPALAPTDFPGVSSARRGKPLPAGYVAVAHRVTVVVGTRRAYPAFTVACPAGKTLRTFANQAGGKIGLQIVGRTPVIRERSFDYVGEHRWAVLGDYAPAAVGTTLSGTVYGLCR